MLLLSELVKGRSVVAKRNARTVVESLDATGAIIPSRDFSRFNEVCSAFLSARFDGARLRVTTIFHGISKRNIIDLRTAPETT